MDGLELNYYLQLQLNFLSRFKDIIACAHFVYIISCLSWKMLLSLLHRAYDLHWSDWIITFYLWSRKPRNAYGRNNAYIHDNAANGTKNNVDPSHRTILWCNTDSNMITYALMIYMLFCYMHRCKLCQKNKLLVTGNVAKVPAQRVWFTLERLKRTIFANGLITLEAHMVEAMHIFMIMQQTGPKTKSVSHLE